jgi:hypothetical protein
LGGGAIADDGKDLDGGPDPRSGIEVRHRGQDRSKRVGREVVAFGVDLTRLGGDSADDSGDGCGVGEDEGLGVERGQDLGGQLAGPRDQTTVAPSSSQQADHEHPRQQPRYEQTTNPVRSPSAVTSALRPRRQHPHIIDDRGNESYRDRRPESPHRA